MINIFVLSAIQIVGTGPIEKVSSEINSNFNNDAISFLQNVTYYVVYYIY